MLQIVKTEIKKLKRSSILLIGIFATFACVMLTRFMASASNAEEYTVSSFSNSVIWNGFSIIFPALISVVVGNMIEKERTEDTLKNISVIPISFRKLISGKLLVGAILAVVLGVIQFLFTVVVAIMSGYPVADILLVSKSFCQMIQMNLLVYIAVMPVIIITCQKGGGFMKGVIFSFFYGFAGIFAAGHDIGDIYPITAGLGLIQYQNDDPMVYRTEIELLVISIMILLSIILIATARNKDIEVEKKKKK